MLAPFLLLASFVPAAYANGPAAETPRAAQSSTDLDELRNRSPEAHWKALSERWRKSERQTQPAGREFAPGHVQPSSQTVPAQPLAAPPAPAAGLQPREVPLFDTGTPADRDQRFQVSGRSNPVGRVAQQPTYRDPGSTSDRIGSPREMKKVTDIRPYFDYEPDPEIAATDPCKNLCPRPENLPCDPDSTQICPDEVQLSDDLYEPRVFSDSLFQWQASNLWHQPLYFEDPQLERYGHTHHPLVQPFVSAGRFGVQLLGLPYQSVIDPFDCRMYTLGWYRPGDRAPRLYHQIPWNTQAAIFQAEVMTGMFYIFP